uniref:Uncharacterized protein n=1 Tax=Erythrolobus madagascarensis TaxID=708628 RepID=A0A7S0T5U2_9RHOD|mmetsp:Transcript_166/g.296  ORF Transcript_166/g.296 Transcript_166/m.296 type:complete len:201 (+) Transcript_166:396-998(+)
MEACCKREVMENERSSAGGVKRDRRNEGRSVDGGATRDRSRREEAFSSNLERVSIGNLVLSGRDPEPVARINTNQSGSADPRRNISLYPSRPKATGKRWTKEDDDKLVQWVRENGPRRWATLANSVFQDSRSPAQLRGRYMDVLNPNRDSQQWTPEEDAKMLALHERIGNRWTLIADELDGRVPNDVKNRFRVLLRKSSN